MSEVVIPVGVIAALDPMLPGILTPPEHRCAWYRNGRLIASDGYALAMVDVEGDIPDGTWIDVRWILQKWQDVRWILQESQDAAMYQDATAVITVDTNGTQGLRIEHSGRYVSDTYPWVPPDGSPPDEMEVYRRFSPDWNDAIVVTIGVELLASIVASALTQDRDDQPITFTIPVSNRGAAISFAFNGERGEVFGGVVMPRTDTVNPRKKAVEG